MVNITKNDKVAVKKTLTKNKNISKAKIEPSKKLLQEILITLKLLAMVRNGLIIFYEHDVLE